jgi:hypothetical protein
MRATLRITGFILLVAAFICGVGVTQAKADSFQITITDATFTDGQVISGTFDLTTGSHGGTISNVEFTSSGIVTSNDWSSISCGPFMVLGFLDACFESSPITSKVSLLIPAPMTLGETGNLGKSSEYFQPIQPIFADYTLTSGTFSVASIPGTAPEPSALLLLAPGLLALALKRRVPRSIAGV